VCVPSPQTVIISGMLAGGWWVCFPVRRMGRQMGVRWIRSSIKVDDGQHPGPIQLTSLRSSVYLEEEEEKRGGEEQR